MKEISLCHPVGSLITSFYEHQFSKAEEKEDEEPAEDKEKEEDV